MTDTDKHLEALSNQCAIMTPFGRLAVGEQHVVLRWLLNNGHMTRTGNPIEQPRLPPAATGHKSDGSPIYAAGADFNPIETIKMPAAGA